MQVSVNSLAVKIIKDEIIPRECELGVRVITMRCGATLIDMGLETKGSIEAGLLFTRVALGGLATIQLGSWQLDDLYSFGAVELHVNEPVPACLASQRAGWQLGEGAFATIGSGPARAQAVNPSDPFGRAVSYRDQNDEVALCIQAIHYPDDAIAREVANACQVDPKNVFLLVAPAASIAGGIQISARVIAEACHKMHLKGFDVSKLVSARGRAPLAPLVRDELRAVSRLNDAILYAGEAELWVDASDYEVMAVQDRLTTKDSMVFYPESFSEVFERAGRDYFKIGADSRSVARVQIHNVRSGRNFVSGEINREMIRKSFLG